MIEFRGTHGTCASRTENIKKTGFRFSDGIRGFGVYFWHKNAFDRDLAIAFYSISRDKRKYDGESDSRCSLISAVIIIEEDEWLDITNQEAEDNILALYKKHGYKNELNASKLYEEYYQELEEELESPFKMVKVKVVAPKLLRNWPRLAVGMPTCYVVRDPSCIKITGIELLGDREVELWNTQIE
jgi:hypothetical protein